ncbi:uncharacterized protein LOC122248488 [Penaeus japonicus]|uniref:uncharacterized protein LOC122248488 n=1 Tax=Penaeus japonicus TaxID=27405 RepID=UPI001C714FF0|nr:uncharacterized protein LOC122248488 [Penaeus japonicus]XP_042864462.1 uncharacterized protein LOC122248488 [Penaeus japonicus]
MRRRCSSPGAAQQALLVFAAVMALTLYYHAPLHTAAPSAARSHLHARLSSNAERTRAKSPTKAPAKVLKRKGGGTHVRAGWHDETAAEGGDYPISLERDTGEDSFASKVMMALEFLTKEKTKKTKVVPSPPPLPLPPPTPRPPSDRGKTSHEAERGSSNQHRDAEPDANPRSRDHTPSTTPPPPPPLPPSGRTCRVTSPPLDFCECTREILAQGGAACPAGEHGGKTTSRDLLSALNRTLGSSTCSDAATLRGANQSVISISLFGAFPSDYHEGLAVVVARAAEAYPGWAVRVYHDLDLAGDARARAWACALACGFPHLDFCSVVSLPGIGDLRPTIGTIWRLAVLGDPFVRRFIIRDSDSPILQREVDAVKEWVDSGKCFHIMRDNLAHTMPIMGGMFGGCGFWHREVLERIRGTIFRFSHKDSHPSYYDQVNEVRFLWPTIQKSFIAHDSYLCKYFPGSRPFPTRRVNRTFVGMRQYRKEIKGDMVKQPCPVACRPPKHKDWEYC